MGTYSELPPSPFVIPFVILALLSPKTCSVKHVIYLRKLKIDKRAGKWLAMSPPEARWHGKKATGPLKRLSGFKSWQVCLRSS